MVVNYEERIWFFKCEKTPYVHALKKQITIRLDSETIDYFKDLSEGNGIPYQTIINLYLRDCAQKHKKLHIRFKEVNTVPKTSLS